MLHRFEDPDTGRRGHSPTELASRLELLREQHYRLVSVADLVEELAHGRRPCQGTVAFTVDDGYRDFLHVGAPVFRKYECPVTVFLVTRAIDGPEWYSWDRVEYLFRRTPRSRVTVEVGGRLVSGLTVRARLDHHTYPKGIKISQAELDRVRLRPDTFHGDWNYTILPTHART